jgi:hypothetical protein
VNYTAGSKSIRPYFYFHLNKKALGARSGVHMTLDLRAHAWIISSGSDCSVTGNQPKSVVVHVVHIALTMTTKVEQHICIKFCQKLEHSETYDMTQKASGNDTMGCTQVGEWFRWFKEGWMLVESDESSWRSSTTGTKWWLTKCVLLCWITTE